MISQETIRYVIDCIEGCGIQYVLVGSLASNTYGIVRSTKDADFVVQTKPSQLSELVKALGERFELEPQVQFETVTGNLKSLLRERDTQFEIELFQLSNDPHDQARFSRRKRIKVFDRDTWVLSVEDVLVTKLNWLHIAKRIKDQIDIESVIAVQGSAIDWPYVENWCDQHGSRKLLDQIRTDIEKSNLGK
jgi:hypothetical protein